MPVFQNGPVTIRYEEAGDGEPLLVIPGGGLNASIAGLAHHVFNPLDVLSDKYRVIAIDLRNANGGESAGPLEIDRPWDSFTDDQLALLDHLGIERCSVLGFCIGGPLIWNLIRRASERVISAVLVHPSGHRSDRPDIFFDMNMNNWGPEITQRRDDITMDDVESFLVSMYRRNPEFVFTVTREFVQQCQTPVLVLPDDIPPHPFAAAMESALLAPRSQVSLYPWKEDDSKVRMALRHVRAFLAARENA